jgi:hypothetical protein
MADEWTVDLGGLAEITEAAAFDISGEATYNENDQLEVIDYVCNITGELIADDLAEAFVELLDLVKTTEPIHVLIKRNGVTQFDWDPTEGFLGPHVVSFRSVPAKGNAHSHWQYQLVITFRGKPDSNENDLYSFTTSFTRVKDKDRVIREVWRASGKAKTRLDAVNGVLAFKPSSKEVSEQITESSTESSAEAVWVWEAIQKIICKVRKTGARDYAESGQVGSEAFPVLHRLTNKARVVTISGVVRDYQRGISAPPAHLSESDQVVRVDSREANDEAAIESPERGIYELPFMEVYLVTGEIPAINHAGKHHLIDLGTAPAPGAILS